MYINICIICTIVLWLITVRLIKTCFKNYNNSCKLLLILEFISVLYCLVNNYLPLRDSFVFLLVFSYSFTIFSYAVAVKITVEIIENCKLYVSLRIYSNTRIVIAQKELPD